MKNDDELEPQTRAIDIEIDQDRDRLQKVLDDHLKWLTYDPAGIKANLSGANLSGTNLSGVKLSGVNLNLADMSGANLIGVNLSNANLIGVNLSNADLSGACLSGADLSGSNLSGADLSGVKNLLSSTQYMADNFEHDDLGWIVYKAIGETYFSAPANWKIEPGSYIKEVVNANRQDDCGCGVNFAKLIWIKKNMLYKEIDVWRCRIRWMDACGIVVPYNTDGKCRCEKLELLEIIEHLNRLKK